MALRLKGGKLLFLIVCFIVILVLYKQYFTKQNNAIAENQIKRENKDVLVLPEYVPEMDKIQDNNLVEHPADSTLLSRALAMNFEQKLYNVDKFGEHTIESFILVVQVHDRVEYFKEFINSLQAVRGIDKATLVISRDKFVPEIENIISSINVCRYMTIFFPYSMQIFPDSFPGDDPNDCPRDISKSDAIAKGCNNAEYPDQFGHYREVKFVQIKHHWFWKLHMVFRGIRAFMNNKAPVLLLEEDYFLAPDVLHCAELGLEFKNKRCPKCDLISLGNYEGSNDDDKVDIQPFTSTKSNMGMIITKDFYDKIVGCTERFCEYDDYNWDWSLQYISNQCITGNLFTVQFKMSKIFHLGSCGGMHSTSNCNIKDELQHIRNVIQTRKNFPASLTLANSNFAVGSLPRPNGGWGDLRDHALCKRFKSLCEVLTQA